MQVFMSQVSLLKSFCLNTVKKKSYEIGWAPIQPHEKVLNFLSKSTIKNPIMRWFYGQPS